MHCKGGVELSGLYPLLYMSERKTQRVRYGLSSQEKEENRIDV